MTQEPPKNENPSDQPNDPKREKDRPVGWIGGLANRSTGLPGDTSDKPKPEREKSPWSYAGMGLQFAGTTAVFAFIGLYLDRRYGWSPWGTVTLSMVGVVGGLYLLIKDALNEN